MRMIPSSFHHWITKRTFFATTEDRRLTVSYALFLFHTCAYFICLLFSLYRLDYSILPTNFIYRILALSIPVLLWIRSTGSNTYNFHQIKTASYYLTVFHESLILISIAYELLSRLFLPGILSLHTDDIFTIGMVMLLARLVTELPLLFLFFAIFFALFRPIRSEKSKKYILSFKYSQYHRPGSKKNQISYSLTIAKDMRTGKEITVSEKDRFLHTLVDGTSGTGKTSSTILPAICSDLNTRCRAEKEQVEALTLLTEQETLIHNANSSFSICDFSHPDEKIQNKIKAISLEHPVCGITVLAPEDSLTDDVCKLCEARGIPYNRIDTTLNADGFKKARWIGMNPFFLSKDLTGDKLQQTIVKKAMVFSDVMQALTDLKGKADSYFTGLNRQMLANLAILIMNTVPVLQNRQATPEDLQLLINNFDLLPPYVNKLEELDRGRNRYTFILQYIKEDLLGRGRPKMEDQSRGTRNIINEFLLMPQSKEVYCAQASIDFEKILERGEITVCNYNLASGDTNAITFGLFFLLSFNNAVLSRPGTEQTRIPHFFYIDELPVLLHSSIEKNFSLFRKFRVAMFCAIQTLDQFEKNDMTKYLKGVVLGCAQIMVFGRSSFSDMKIFSAMAGTHEDTEEQFSTSETSLSDESPALSYSTRELFTQKNILEETDIRMRDFQEATFFTTTDGRPLPPLHVRVDFLKPEDWSPTGFRPLSFEHLRSQVSDTNQSVPKQNDPITDSVISIQQQTASYHFPSMGSTVPKPENTEVKSSADPTDIKEPEKFPDGSESLEGIF